MIWTQLDSLTRFRMSNASKCRAFALALGRCPPNVLSLRYTNCMPDAFLLYLFIPSAVSSLRGCIHESLPAQIAELSSVFGHPRSTGAVQRIPLCQRWLAPPLGVRMSKSHQIRWRTADVGRVLLHPSLLSGNKPRFQRTSICELQSRDQGKEFRNLDCMMMLGSKQSGSSTSVFQPLWSSPSSSAMALLHRLRPERRT